MPLTLVLTKFCSQPTTRQFLLRLLTVCRLGICHYRGRVSAIVYMYAVSSITIPVYIFLCDTLAILVLGCSNVNAISLPLLQIIIPAVQ